MPMSINFSEQGLKTLMSPPPPAQPLSDIILTIKVSKDLNALAMIGREVLRGCVSSRKYKPPILDRFELEVDEIISDRILARVARQSSLLERLKVHEVASDLTDIAHILCAYLGATFMCSFKSEGSNQIHESINDICAMVLDDSAREETEADSHERMLMIPGMERMKSPIKQEPAPSYSSSTRAPSTVSHIFDNNSIESVSSGRSPPPVSYGAHYQQPFQPYYSPHNATIAPPHMQPMHAHTLQPRYSSYAPGPGPVHTSNPATFAQPQPMYNTPPPPPATMPSQTVYPTQPPGAMPLGGYPGMGMPQNPGFVPPAVAPPVPVPASQQNQGYISLVNELAMKNRRSITWQQAKVGQQHMPEWTMWLSVDGEVRGQGTAPTKQAAKEIASKLALQSMGWMQG
ncbi:unnamed protein product [Rhizoctonia solani]|uniref:DRBM domain-containing protein n=1 Tax=Rhizoctonia solani TaxID=456999 RepID=A0A8H3C0M7_9AGAM|nr:unnamed protein product [Rhizoctonia solani]